MQKTYHVLLLQKTHLVIINFTWEKYLFGENVSLLVFDNLSELRGSPAVFSIPSSGTKCNSDSYYWQIPIAKIVTVLKSASLRFQIPA